VPRTDERREREARHAVVGNERPADGQVRIAADQRSVAGVEEADLARGMAFRVDHFERHAGQGPLAVLDFEHDLV
jgi:hypothetical protein